MIIRTDTTTAPAVSASRTQAAANIVLGAGGVNITSGATTNTNAKPVRVPTGVVTHATPGAYQSGHETRGLSEHTAEGVSLDDPYQYSVDREHAAQAADKSLQQTDADGNPIGTSDSVQVETQDIDAVKAQIMNPNIWSDDKLAELGQKMYNAGLISDPNDRQAIETQWGDLVDKAAARYAANPDSALTPEDMITLYGGNGLDGKPKQPTTTTTINKSVSLLGNDDARKVVGQLIHMALGRKPTDGEIDDFQVAINGAMHANPDVTRSTSTTDIHGNTSTSSSRTTGADPELQAKEHFDQDKSLMKEYAHYQAATTLTNWAMQALRGPVGQ